MTHMDVESPVISSPGCQRAEVCLYCEGPAGVSACLLQIHLLCLGSASSRQLCRGESRETWVATFQLREDWWECSVCWNSRGMISWFVDFKVVRFNKAGCSHIWLIHSPPVPISGGQEVSLNVLGTCWTSPLFTSISPVRPYHDCSAVPLGPQVVNVTNGSIIVEFLLRPRAHTDSPLNGSMVLVQAHSMAQAQQSLLTCFLHPLAPVLVIHLLVLLRILGQPLSFPCCWTNNSTRPTVPCEEVH